MEHLDTKASFTAVFECECAPDKQDESRFKQPSCAAVYNQFLEFLGLFSVGNTLLNAADQAFDEDA